VLVLTTIGCDHATKQLANRTLKDGPSHSYLADTLRLDYAENTGAFLSLGEELPDCGRTWILAGGSLLCLAVVAVAMVKYRWTGWARVGAILFIAGGVSNLIDRILWGYVIDFMNIGIGSLRTGIFNVADVALMAGLVLIVFGDRDTRTPEA
jgi:signal peptidase II